MERPAAVFGVILAWKLLLLASAQLPTPSNDSFFYDAAAVNLASHGKYVAPSLALALPISANETFSAYPPLYPLAMAGWMKIFGTSALSAMWLHWTLFSVAAILLLFMCRRLKLPAWTISLGGLFLICISFHDRPDSLAHVFGLAAVYSLACWVTGTDAAGRFTWWAVTGVVLTLGTGLQIGALYLAVTWVCLLLGGLANGRRLPVAALAASVVVPAVLIAGVVVLFPRIWTGFIEHAHQTPSVTGLRMPRVDEILKLARTLPGTLAAAVVVLWLRPITFLRRLTDDRTQPQTVLDGSRWPIFLLGLLVPSVMLAAASMTFFTPNGVLFAAYLQPLIVAVALAVTTEMRPKFRKSCLVLGIVLLAGFGSIRMVGLSTWGLALARDCGYGAALTTVREELAILPRGTRVVSSAAYLYEVSGQDVQAVHCDWLGKAGPNQDEVDWEGLLKQRPPLILLTQFDYYRRYEPLLERLKARPDLVAVSLKNHARVRPPDAIRPLRRVVQHLSWAPIVVKLDWVQP